MTRSRLLRLGAVALLLLALPALLPTAQAQLGPPCSATALCHPCPGTTTARPCVITICDGVATRNCGSCVNGCVPPF